MSLVATLLAAREREIQNPRDEANRVAGRKAKQALARELGGEEHIPLAIEIYIHDHPRWWTTPRTGGLAGLRRRVAVGCATC